MAEVNEGLPAAWSASRAVDGRGVRVERERLRVDVEVEDLGEVGPLEQQLLPGDEVGDEVDFGVVQAEEIPVGLPVEIRDWRGGSWSRSSRRPPAAWPSECRSSLDCVARIIAAFCLRHVLSASVM